MRLLEFPTLLALGWLLSTPAMAQFSVTGSGSLIPAIPTDDGVWDTTMPSVPAVSAVTVPVPVFRIDSIVIRGLSHAWLGDMQCTLVDPSGIEHLIFVRPGYAYNGSTYGNSGDFLYGDYEFVESGAPNDLPIDDLAVDLNPGQYNQTFDTGGVVWNSGASNVFNTPMTQITGPSGVWELHIYDWYYAADDGNFLDWTLNGNGAGGSGGFCYGDGTGTVCPCANSGLPGHGCDNSVGTGAALSSSGSATIGADTVVLHASSCPPGALGIFFQGVNQLGGGTGLLFGDGLRCTGGAVQRLQIVQSDPGGTVASSVPISVVGQMSAPGTRYYQLWYSDPAGPCGTGFNTTNAVLKTWN